VDFIAIQGRRLEYQFEPTGAPVMVFLHEGLGSIAMWKDFPQACARNAGCDALVYSRFGYGWSDPLDGQRRVDYMHHEALKTLPELLDQLRIERPILLGHSDGASIALIYAGGAGREVRGVIAMAPHVMVEPKGIAGIEAVTRDYQTSLRAKLARYHAHPDSAFRGWSDIWLSPEFRTWNIEEYVRRIACPVLAIQGVEDEYGTMEQLERIAKAAPQTEILALDGCGHAPHRDQTDAVCNAVNHLVTESYKNTCRTAQACVQPDKLR
jgi:pimeloyl-ACP methyl ester carboxylesterase